jgi:uncharacterized protein
MEPKITVKEYFAALSENRLLGVKCKNCGFITAPPRMACRKCSGLDTEPIELSGRGKIATFTSVHVAPENHRGQAPYLVIIVELDEGSWIMGNLSGIDPQSASIELIGRRVTMKNSPPLSGNDKQDPAPLFVLDSTVLDRER